MLVALNLLASGWLVDWSKVGPPLPTRCSVPPHGNTTGAVTHLQVKGPDGVDDRCYATRYAAPTTKPMAVLLFHHGAGSNAEDCGNYASVTGEPMWAVVARHGFALVCTEAIQYENSPWPLPGMSGGLWHLQDNVTAATGNKCGPDYGPTVPGYDLRDITYLHAVVSSLQEQPDLYDTSRLFLFGCSMGAMFSSYSAQCLHETYGGALTAWSVISSGLKSYGDGTIMPGDPAECPGCYFPFWPGDAPASPPLKACVFDNKDDDISIAKNLLETSYELNRTWTELGNRAELVLYPTGGHCGAHSFDDIFACLDDGTGKLLGAAARRP